MERVFVHRPLIVLCIEVLVKYEQSLTLLSVLGKLGSARVLKTRLKSINDVRFRRTNETLESSRNTVES